jgi:hypothetical protein
MVYAIPTESLDQNYMKISGGKHRGEWVVFYFFKLFQFFLFKRHHSVNKMHCLPTSGSKYSSLNKSAYPKTIQLPSLGTAQL